ncbi:MAG: hypothetical protein ABI682_10565 [Acidobacteriota bacterium]
MGPPLHFAAAAWFLGWDFGPFVVSPLAAVVSLLLLYLVAREIGLSRASGFSCAVTVERADLAAGSVEAMSFEARGERIL